MDECEPLNLGCGLESGKGVAAPDYPAAVGWFRRAAESGHGPAAINLSDMYAAGRGGDSHVCLACNAHNRYRGAYIGTIGYLHVGLAYNACQFKETCRPSFLELNGVT